MSQICNLSTSAVRDSVSARVPPTHPTPITAASTVFTGRIPLQFLLLIWPGRAAARRHTSSRGTRPKGRFLDPLCCEERAAQARDAVHRGQSAAAHIPVSYTHLRAHET